MTRIDVLIEKLELMQQAFKDNNPNTANFIGYTQSELKGLQEVLFYIGHQDETSEKVRNLISYVLNEPLQEFIKE